MAFALPLIVHRWLARWRTWWHKQPPTRQDHYAMIAPAATILLFLLVVFLTIAYLRIEEASREQEDLQHDMDSVQFQLRTRLQDRKGQLLAIAKNIGLGVIEPSNFAKKSDRLALTTPELLALVWIDNQYKFRATYFATGVPIVDGFQWRKLAAQSETAALYARVQNEHQPLYSAPYLDADGRGLIQLQAPILNAQKQILGAVVAELSLDLLLQNGVSSDITKKYGTAFIAGGHQHLAGVLSNKVSLAPDSFAWVTRFDSSRELIADFEPNESDQISTDGDAPLQLVLQGYRSPQGFTGTALRFLVAALSMLTIWMLLANWRHARHRLRTQDELLAETNFRRAMENSMPTGMRAVDLEGRITYVNAAFCQMTQWREADLMGSIPPYVYWPPEDAEKLLHTFEQELSGSSSASGAEMQVLRRDGTRFAARMYLSPLVDARGKQTGWMASMTDITEPKRVREELESSYERFITILEGMDASISVSTLGSRHLLFANKTYREWFGEDSHDQPDFVSTLLAEPSDATAVGDVDVLAGRPLREAENSPSGSKEIYVEASDQYPARWLEVRVRYLNWVDGHLAQMVIANDITAKRQAEAFAAAQAERAQASSRLITMGEMASSVAHELNQPLAAISNYCSGIVSRLHSNQISGEDLVQAIEKTAKQAKRAGQIIQRIRSFVTRSAPNRSPSDMAQMLTEALDLVGIEVQRRRVQLTQRIEQNLPRIMVDPILIEQVIINLIKNAAEAIDVDSEYSPNEMARRQIKVQVSRKARLEGSETQDGIECSVEDTGKGVPPEMLKNIFDAFYTTKLEGMGIGLNLCRSIIESHQGRLVAENLYNATRANQAHAVHGCRFSFWLPLHAVPTSTK